MHCQRMATVMVVLGFLAVGSATAGSGQGLGVCKSGFSDDTVVSTESRGEVTISQVRINDRVWSYNQALGKKGWSKVLRRVDAGPHYKILADFTEPGSSAVTRACWIIARGG